jgi:membrane protein
MFNRTIDFLQNHIWRLRFEDMPTHQRWLLRPLRVIVLAVRGFDEDRIHVRASALTYYTLLSVVPALAVAFGIAQGFGLEDILERVIRSSIRGQEDVVDHIVTWAQSLLSETRGGIVAGIGVVFLFWSIVRLLGTVELSFNDIWGLPRGRGFARRVLDYLAITLLAPILLVVSGNVTTNLNDLASRATGNLVHVAPGGVAGVLVSLLAATTLFTFMYRFMPNTSVRFRAAALGGAVAGCAFQIMQWAYVRAQVELARANAVYGTFSALPLFLIWLQLSWLVILIGAEIAYAVDNEETYAAERSFSNVSLHVQRILALWLTQKIAKRFHAGEAPYTSVELAHALGVPARIVRKVLYDLVAAGVLSSHEHGRTADATFQPTRSTESLTVKWVLDALHHAGHEPTFELRSEELTSIRSALEEIDRLIRTSPANAPLHEL